MLNSTVHRINARAEVRVTNELIKEFKRVTGKENLLFKAAEATGDTGDKLVRDTVFPVAPQGVLRDLVAEFKSSGPTYQRTVKATLRSSYTNHYRAGLIKLLSVLDFRSNNSTHRPVLDALELISRYAGTSLRYYPAGDEVPVHRGVSGDWAELVHQVDKHGTQRVVRMVYEPPRSRLCGISCGARKSGLSVPRSGATPPRICRPILIYYGKTSEIVSNRRDEQEMSVLCLCICQAALVYVNVLMIQDILADPEWDGGLTAEDERGLTPLFWSHVLPYGEVKLNMNSRLALGG
ncbi:Tn3 family transposase [Nocardia sp. NPDC023852]|uniref:Tn3 family transposase n=1 Tax=Nocardia sp. NPDC023852 TaxID=3154697 RepID=UPI0033FE1BDE